MMLFQQFCRINAILTNLSDIMNESGLDIDGDYQAGIVSCAHLITVVVGTLIIDKIGHRITMIISCCKICVFLLIFALNDRYDWSNVLPLICIFLYQLGFGLGMGPVPWFIIPEYFKDDVRSTATMIVMASNWIFAFLVILVWPYMKDGMFGALIFFVCISFCAIFFYSNYFIFTYFFRSLHTLAGVERRLTTTTRGRIRDLSICGKTR